MQSRHTQVYLKLMSLYTIILMFAHCLYNPLEILDFFNEFKKVGLGGMNQSDRWSLFICDYTVKVFSVINRQLTDKFE